MQAHFNHPMFADFWLANVHIISGSFKSDQEKHMIPGKSPDDRNAFKVSAMRGVVKRLAALAKPKGQRSGALAKPQGQRSGGTRFYVAGDLNMLEDSMVAFCGAASIEFQQSIEAITHSEEATKRRDWIVSNGPLVFVKSPTMMVVAHDKSHYAIVGQSRDVEQSAACAAEASPSLAAKQINQLRAESLQKAQDDEAAARQTEMAQDGAVVAAEPRVTTPRLLVQVTHPGGMQLTVERDGEPTQVLDQPFVKHGMWLTGPPGACAAAQRDDSSDSSIDTPCRRPRLAGRGPGSQDEAPAPAAPKKSPRVADVRGPPAPPPSSPFPSDVRGPSRPFPWPSQYSTPKVPPYSTSKAGPYSTSKAVPPSTWPKTTSNAGPPRPASAPQAAASSRATAEPGPLAAAAGSRATAEPGPPAAAAGPPAIAEPPTPPPVASAVVDLADDAELEAADAEAAAKDQELASEAAASAAARGLEVPCGGARRLDGPGFVRIVSDPEYQVRALNAVLECRSRIIKERGESEEPLRMAGWETQKLISKAVQTQWWAEKDSDECRQVQDRTVQTEDAMRRTIEGYFRAAVRCFFGDAAWFKFVVAMGMLPPLEFKELVADPNRDAGVSGSRGTAEPQPRMTGVMHVKSEAKRAREKAKHRVKQLDAMEKAAARGEWVQGLREKRQEVEAGSRQSERGVSPRAVPRPTPHPRPRAAAGHAHSLPPTPGPRRQQNLDSARRSALASLAGATRQALQRRANSLSEESGIPYGNVANQHKQPGKFEVALRKYVEEAMRIEWVP